MAFFEELSLNLSIVREKEQTQFSVKHVNELLDSDGDTGALLQSIGVLLSGHSNAARRCVRTP